MIAEVLGEGAENAKTGRELCELLNIKPRDLTQLVAQERRAGLAICSTTNSCCPGYFMAKDQEEMRIFCRSLQHRAGEIFKTRKACLETIDRLPARGTAGGSTPAPPPVSVSSPSLHEKTQGRA